MWRRNRSVSRAGFVADAIDCRSGGISHRIVCCGGRRASGSERALEHRARPMRAGRTEHGDPKPCAAVELGSGRRRRLRGPQGHQGSDAVFADTDEANRRHRKPRAAGAARHPITSPMRGGSGTWSRRVLGHAMPRDTLSLAINSELARSQNQLHIHIDCVRADVRDALRRERAAIGRRWKPLPVLLAGHRYSAMRITGRSLAGHDPFKLLARGVPGAAADMGQHTLVVVGMQYAHSGPGFVILDDHADPGHGDDAGGEELQDHTCALARRKS